MTQDHGAVAARPPSPSATQQQDPLLRMLFELRNDRQRMRVTTPSVEQLASEVTDTLGSYMEDMLTVFLQMRNWVSESLADVDDRLNGLEASGGLDLDGDLVEKITKLCGGCRALAEATREAAQDDESRKMLDELIALCDEVMNDILGDDEEEDGDEGSAPGDSPDDPAEA